MNNWVKFIGRILAGLLCCLTAATTAVSSPAAPPTEEAGVATLYRDLWGVPHIYAKREEDGFYALGFAQAEDQLLGILSAALAVEGRAAAVFGEGDLPWNIPMALVEPGSLIWRHAEEAKAAYARLGPAMRRNQEAYVAGFNAYLAEHPERVPDWAPRLEPWHLIGIPRTILWFFIIGDGRRESERQHRF
jgi:acyl-homoserine lactone acylase PvdQ